MKKPIQLTLTALTFVALSACSYTSKPSDSQKNALESVSSDTHPKEKGAMQNSLDTWLSQDWTPTVEKDENIQKKYMDSEIKKTNNGKEEHVNTEDPKRPFTLQEYADKAGAYMKAHENDPKKPSHVEKMSKMPVIGN
jgi:hypothetical protein